MQEAELKAVHITADKNESSGIKAAGGSVYIMGENGANLRIQGERDEALAASTRTDRTGVVVEDSQHKSYKNVKVFGTEISKGIEYMGLDEKQHRKLLLAGRLDDRPPWLKAFEKKLENIGKTKD